MIYFGLGAAALIASGAIGGHMASAKGKNSLDWFWVCVMLPGLGHLLLHLRPAEAADDTSSGQQHRPARNRRKASPAVAAPPTTTTVRIADAGPPRLDAQQHWTYLVEADPILNAAVRKLAPLGPEAVQHLRDAFFAQQDRTLVPGIVARIEAHYRANTVRASSPPPLKQPVVSMVTIANAKTSTTAGRAPAPTVALSSLASVRAATLSARSAPTTEPPLRTLARTMPATAARLVPRHTTVTPHELETAEYLETCRGVHLYRLEDGRVYVDGHLALASLEAARNLIAQAARNAMTAAAIGGASATAGAVS